MNPNTHARRLSRPTHPPAPQTYAHNTIRLDEEDILKSVGRLAAKAAAGEHVKDWEICSLKVHWAVMHR